MLCNSYNYCKLIVFKCQVVCLKMCMCCFILSYNPKLNVYHFFHHFSPSVLSISYQCLFFVVPFQRKCSYSFINFLMKHLYLRMSWPEDMDMLWINFLSFFFLPCDFKSFHDSSYISRGMRFPTMWYMRPAMPQISLRIQAVWSEPLQVAWKFYECLATDCTLVGVSKLKGNWTGLSESTLVKMPHCWKSMSRPLFKDKHRVGEDINSLKLLGISLSEVACYISLWNCLFISLSEVACYISICMY